MTNTQKSYRVVFFDTNEPRVKVCVQRGINKVGQVTSLNVTLAVEDLNRPGVWFAIGDRLHFDVTKFPEMEFHANIASKLSRSFASKDISFDHDVVAFAKELTEKLA